jgi:hypothetical protein
VKSQTFHDCKARAVDQRKVLIRERLTNGPCPFEIGGRDRFNNCYTSAKPLPELLGCVAVQAPSEQKPGLNQDVVGCD